MSEYNYVHFDMMAERPKFAGFSEGLHVGERAPDFAFEDLDTGDLRPPAVQELARELDLPLREVERFLQRAARLGLVVRVAGNRFFPPEVLRRLGEHAELLAASAEDGMFSAATFRDRTGIGRNLTIEVVEFFDRVGFTRRNGNARQVLRRAAEVSWSRAS